MSAFDWQNMWGQHDGGDLTEHGAYQAVSWVRRCVDVRCNALSAIPVKYYRGQGTTQRSWEYEDQMAHILWMTEAALQLYGAAYWLRLRNPFGFEKGYRWLLPSSVKPKYDKVKGLVSFERAVGGGDRETLSPDQLLYVWAPNLATEIGPGKGWVSTVLTESGIARHMNTFASEFFERGALPGMVLSVEGNPSRDELDRLEQWWKRFVAGVKRAWETVALRASVKPVPIGYPTDQLAMPELLSAVRQQIAVAAGVPQTMLEDAANFATASEHHQAFYQETVVPEAIIIEAALNAQLFGPVGMRCSLDWQSLDIFQEDEAERAQALTQYTMAGVPLYLAMEMLGIDLPNEMTYEQLAALLEEDKAKKREAALQIAQARRLSPIEEQPPPGEQREEARRWQRKASKALAAGKCANVDFDTDAFTPEEQAAIRDRLALASTDEEVKAAFAAPFRVYEGYP